MGNLSANFDTSEPGISCRCGCGFGSKVSDTDPKLWEVLEDVRAHFGGNPVYINSCCRCTTHNRNVGGASSSQHLKGTAADAVVSGVSPYLVADYLESKYGGKYGIGRYSTFTHFDTRDNGPARWGG